MAEGERRKGAAKFSDSLVPCVMFGCSSIGMILLNKGVMRAYPFPSLLLILQVFSPSLCLL